LARGIEQRQLPQIVFKTRQVNKLHFNNRDILYRGIFGERKINIQRFGQTHQVVKAL
jgi:hypothetical protein